MVKPTFRLKKLETLSVGLRYELGKFVGDTINDKLIHEVAAAITGCEDRLNTSSVEFLLRSFLRGETFTELQRAQVAQRVANFYDILSRTDGFIGSWQAFSYGEWIAVKIIGVQPVSDAGVTKVKVTFLNS